MKKIFLISSLVIIFVGLVFVVMRNRPTVNDVDSFPGANKTESTTTNGTNGAVKIKPPSGVANKQSVKTPDALWISTSFFQKSDELYFDLDVSGNLIAKKGTKYGKEIAEIRVGSAPQELVEKILKVANARGVLNAKDTGTGEPLFSQSEWVRVSVMLDGKIKSSQAGYGVPIEDFPVDFQDLFKELKSVAEKQPIASDTKGFLFAELAGEQQVQFIKNDPKLEFITFSENDFNADPIIRNAVQMLGRQFPVYNEELQKIEGYIKLSKGTKAFFINVSGKYYYFRLLSE